MNKKLLGILIGLGITLGLIGVIATSLGEQKETMSDKTMTTEEMAPPIKLMDLEGNTVDLAALQGEKVYVKFWASWCSICLAGMAELNELAAQDNDFKIITIVSPGVNGEQEKADFIEWFKGLEYKNIQVLLDETGEVTKAYKVRAYPTSAFIDETGGLLYLQPGHLSNERINEVFEGK